MGSATQLIWRPCPADCPLVSADSDGGRSRRYPAKVCSRRKAPNQVRLSLGFFRDHLCAAAGASAAKSYFWRARAMPQSVRFRSVHHALAVASVGRFGIGACAGAGRAVSRLPRRRQRTEVRRAAINIQPPGRSVQLWPALSRLEWACTRPPREDTGCYIRARDTSEPGERKPVLSFGSSNNRFGQRPMP
jgi:hypothetical protein